MKLHLTKSQFQVIRNSLTRELAALDKRFSEAFKFDDQHLRESVQACCKAEQEEIKTVITDIEAQRKQSA